MVTASVLDDFRRITDCELSAPLNEVAQSIARNHVSNVQDRAALAADILIALQVARFTGRQGDHFSDCAVHNEPAYPAGPCSCGEAPAAPAKAQA